MSSQAANLSFNGSDLGAFVNNRGMSISDNSFSQDSESEGEITDLKSERAVMMPPTVAKDMWQRKHNRYVMSALQMRPSICGESKNISICEKQHHHQHHHHHNNDTTTTTTTTKTKKRVAFAFDVSVPVCVKPIENQKLFTTQFRTFSYCAHGSY